jgi:hypothetical protein
VFPQRSVGSSFCASVLSPVSILTPLIAPIQLSRLTRQEEDAGHLRRRGGDEMRAAIASGRNGTAKAARWATVLAALMSPAAMTAQVSSAQVSSTAALDYAGPEACPDEGRLIDEIAARLGRAGIDPLAERVARVRIFLDGAEFSATIELPGAGARSVRSGDCADLVATVASLLATELDASAVSIPSEPPTAVPPPPMSPATIRIRVEPEEPGLMLHRAVRVRMTHVPTQLGFRNELSAGFDEVCEAPCVTSLLAGRHHFVVTRVNAPGGGAAPESIRLDADSLLRIGIESHRDDRVAGWLTYGLGTLAGVAALMSGFVVMMLDLGPDGVIEDATLGPSIGLMVGGVVLFVVAAAIGIPLAARADLARIAVEPLRF